MKKLLLAVLSATCILSLAFSLGASARNNANETWSEIAIPDSLVIDDTLEIPSAKVTVDGKTYDAKAKLVYPDKTAVIKTDDYPSANLNVAGVYTLVFEAKDGDGARYIKEEKFTVADKLFRITDPKSSIKYGHDSLADDGVNGLLVNLTRKDTLSFGKIIDLKDITKETILLSGFITPSMQGSFDFDRIVFTFTDVYDPECTLSFQGRRSISPDVHANGISYWMSWGNGQKGSGYEGSNFHHGDEWGTPYTHSFLAMSTGRGEPLTSYPQPSNTNEFKLKFDPSEVKSYVSDEYVTDLDNPLLHDGENIWGGFKSGKVKLTVKVYDVVGETANFCLTSVLGYDLTAENSFAETDAPIITVEDEDGVLDSEGNYIPKAVVGGTFPVLGATAFDEYSGKTDVKAEVYYNYANPNARVTCIIEDGRFKVSNIGKYTVVYTATDLFGNESKLICNITSVSRLPKVLAVSANPSPEMLSGVCGTNIPVAEPVAEGGSGKIKISVYAEHGGKSFEVTDGYFFPEEAGEWTVRYVAADITTLSAEATYKVAVSAGDKPIIPDNLPLPEYIVSGLKYEVPEIYAIDYSSGTKKEILATLSMTDKNGTKEYKAGETYIPEVNSNGEEVTLTVKAGASTLTKQVKAIVCYEEDLLKIERLFVGEGFETQKTDDGLIVKATKSGNLKWTFANPVAARNSGVTIAGVKGKDNFETLEVTFTDSVDKSIAITAKIINVKGKNARIQFGDADREISQGFSLTDNTFEIGFDGEKVKVGRIAVGVDKTDFGAGFGGFPSKKVYITVKITNAAVGAEYNAKKFDNNGLTRLSVDKIKPRIAVNGDYGGMYDVGDVYTIASAIATDTVSPTLKLVVTAKTPSGAIVKDENGTEISGVTADKTYSFRITESGQYKVEYSTRDEAGNLSTLNYGINILDKVAPTIKLAKTVKTAKIGDKITLPEAVITDDVTPSDKIIVYRTVRCPDGRLNVIGNSEDNIGENATKTTYVYTFGYAGEYKFMILAMDEAGNQTLAEFTVTVE